MLFDEMTRLFPPENLLNGGFSKSYSFQPQITGLTHSKRFFPHLTDYF